MERKEGKYALDTTYPTQYNTKLAIAIVSSYVHVGSFKNNFKRIEEVTNVNKIIKR